MLIIYLSIGLIFTVVYLFSVGDGKTEAKFILVTLFLWPVFVYYFVRNMIDKRERKHKTE